MLLFDELINSLTAERNELFTQQLNEMTGETVDASFLDELVGEVTGFGTSFFTKNIQEATGLYPFLLEDSRDVLIAGTSYPDVRIIIERR